MSSSSAPPAPPPEITTEPTETDKEIARLRERVKELEARLAPPEALAASNDQPQFSSIVLFGADGNLATKKTFPTLFALWRKKLLPRDIVIVGYAREVMSTEEFRKNIVYRAIYSSAHAQRERRRFLQRVHYCSGQFDDATHVRERLAPLLAKRAAASADASRRWRRDAVDAAARMISTQARGEAGPRRLRLRRRAPPTS